MLVIASSHRYNNTTVISIWMIDTKKCQVFKRQLIISLLRGLRVAHLWCVFFFFSPLVLCFMPYITSVSIRDCGTSMFSNVYFKHTTFWLACAIYILSHVHLVIICCQCLITWLPLRYSVKFILSIRNFNWLVQFTYYHMCILSSYVASVQLLDCPSIFSIVYFKHPSL